MTQQQLADLTGKLMKTMANISGKSMETLQNLSAGDCRMPDVADQASAESDRAFSLAICERDRVLLKEIRHALELVDRGEYGFCSECGEEIGIPRLRAQPMATLCFECQSLLEQEQLKRREARF